jgi:hypothetical protein
MLLPNSVHRLYRPLRCTLHGHKWPLPRVVVLYGTLAVCAAHKFILIAEAHLGSAPAIVPLVTGDHE